MIIETGSYREHVFLYDFVELIRYTYVYYSIKDFRRHVMRRKLLLVFVISLCVSLAGCNFKVNTAKAQEEEQRGIESQEQTVKADEDINLKENEKADFKESGEADSKESEGTGSIVYQNTQYNFSFALPAGWKGYKIITDKWEGFVLGEPEGEKTVTGPMITIRHPAWKENSPRQDIPVMVFTLEQWNQLQQDKFHIGAAPIGPSELGRNSDYVFALPARYNFAFPEGYEEVEDIIKSKPLKPISQ